MKSILIIGASTGIGASLARVLTERGDRVIGTFNKSQPALKDDLFKPIRLNVMDENAVIDFIPESVEGFVYCPGAINLKPFKRIKSADFIADYELQVGGAIRMLQAALPALAKGNNPSALFFSTVAVQQGYNFHSLVASSKGAIEGLTRSLAAELAPTIRVNAIAPSITQTPLAKRLLNSDEKIAANGQRHALRRVGQPQDIAEMAAFLLSDKASWITGQIMAVDGGISTLKV